jgi:TPR repeat protein
MNRKKFHSNPVAIRCVLRCMALALSVGVRATAFAGDLYSEGVDAALAGDYQTASKKWAQLAVSHDGRAQFQLALLYHAGLFVDRNEAMAVQFYRSAAENGVPEAQEYLAAGFANGWFGLPRNDALAEYWQNQLNRRVGEQLAQR